jgi:hypothetical protein
MYLSREDLMGKDVAKLSFDKYSNTIYYSSNSKMIKRANSISNSSNVDILYYEDEITNEIPLDKIVSIIMEVQTIGDKENVYVTISFNSFVKRNSFTKTRKGYFVGEKKSNLVDKFSMPVYCEKNDIQKIYNVLSDIFKNIKIQKKIIN